MARTRVVVTVTMLVLALLSSVSATATTGRDSVYTNPVADEASRELRGPGDHPRPGRVLVRLCNRRSEVRRRLVPPAEDHPVQGPGGVGVRRRRLHAGDRAALRRLRRRRPEDVLGTGHRVLRRSVRPLLLVRRERGKRHALAGDRGRDRTAPGRTMDRLRRLRHRPRDLGAAPGRDSVAERHRPRHRRHTRGGALPLLRIGPRRHPGGEAVTRRADRGRRADPGDTGEPLRGGGSGVPRRLLLPVRLGDRWLLRWTGLGVPRARRTIGRSPRAVPQQGRRLDPCPGRRRHTGPGAEREPLGERRAHRDRHRPVRSAVARQSWHRSPLSLPARHGEQPTPRDQPAGLDRRMADHERRSGRPGRPAPRTRLPTRGSPTVSSPAPSLGSSGQTATGGRSGPSRRAVTCRARAAIRRCLPGGTSAATPGSVGRSALAGTGTEAPPGSSSTAPATGRGSSSTGRPSPSWWS